MPSALPSKMCQAPESQGSPAPPKAKFMNGKASSSLAPHPAPAKPAPKHGYMRRQEISHVAGSAQPPAAGRCSRRDDGGTLGQRML